MNLSNSYLNFCKKNNFEINISQLEIIDSLETFLNQHKSLFNYFFKSKKYQCFYLHGNVGVGKTMLINFIYNKLQINKKKLHFNEFMVNFHDFRHEKKNDNSIESFVKELKKECDLIFLDEFQVTNIVDAMILGKLFELILHENIKILITSNTKPENLYKDGLQREQFLPFIKIIKNISVQKELLIENDYRKSDLDKSYRIFYPLNEKINFKINQNFHELTKNKKKKIMYVNTKGRKLDIVNFHEGIAKFDFKELCDTTLGAEDYLNIAKICHHIFIENVPEFNDDNSNQQLRFITLIDILYEKKISLTLSMSKQLDIIGSSFKHKKIFKRTESRLFQMTKIS